MTTMSRRKVLLIAVTLAGALYVLTLLLRRGGTEVVAPLPDDQVEMTVDFEGQPHKLAHGVIYRVRSDGQWEVIQRVFDPEEVARSYVREGDQVLRETDDRTQRYPVRVPFEGDFEGVPEGVPGLRQLIGPKHGWSELFRERPFP